jgi:hypothetical protein
VPSWLLSWLPFAYSPLRRFCIDTATIIAVEECIDSCSLSVKKKTMQRWKKLQQFLNAESRLVAPAHFACRERIAAGAIPAIGSQLRCANKHERGLSRLSANTAKGALKPAIHAVLRRHRRPCTPLKTSADSSKAGGLLIASKPALWSCGAVSIHRGSIAMSGPRSLQVWMFEAGQSGG